LLNEGVPENGGSLLTNATTTYAQLKKVKFARSYPEQVFQGADRGFKDGYMAAAASNYVLTQYPAPETLGAGRTWSRRSTSQAARAQKILGHAIEYLTDEFVQSGESNSADDDLLEAVKLLMALNHQAYHESAQAPTLWQQLHTFLRLA